MNPSNPSPADSSVSAPKPVLSEQTIKRAIAALEGSSAAKRREIEGVHPADPKAVKFSKQAEESDAAARELLALLTLSLDPQGTKRFKTAASDAVAALEDFERVQRTLIAELERQGGFQEGKLELARMMAASAQRSKDYFAGLLRRLLAGDNMVAAMMWPEQQPPA